MKRLGEMVKHACTLTFVGLVSWGFCGQAVAQTQECTARIMAFGLNGPECRPGPSPCDVDGDHCVTLRDVAIVYNNWVPRDRWLEDCWLERVLRSPVWEHLLGVDAAPHVCSVTNERAIAKILEPGYIEKLVEMGFGWLLLDEPLYTDRQYPVEGHYHYANPELIARLKAELRAKGIKVVGYMAGWYWKVAGLTPEDALAEIERLDVDGMYFDNGEIGRTPAETLAFFRDLHATGCGIQHHTSKTPHAPNRGYTYTIPPWDTLYVTHRRVNETGPYHPGPINRWEPEDLDDPRWKYWVSGVLDDGSIWLGQIKEGSWKQTPGGERVIMHDSRWRDRHAEYVPRLAAWGCTYRASPGRQMLIFEEYYHPHWADLVEKYRNDRPAFEAAIARVWGR